MGRKTFQRGEFGSSAQRCAERRSHRPATRPCAAYRHEAQHMRTMVHPAARAIQGTRLDTAETKKPG
jgi:hypothetical protein